MLALIMHFSSFEQTFNYVVFTPADGLPQGYINFLFQDSHGYMWIGSCGGLTRYDGKTFTSYGFKDGLRDVCNSILMEDNRQRVWGVSYVYNNPAVIKFTGGKFISFPFAANDSVRYVYALSEAEDSSIWAMTTNDVFKLNDGHWKKIKAFDYANDKSVRQVILLSDHSSVINYFSKIALKKNDGSIKVIADSSECKWYNLIFHYKNSVLIVGSNRLFIYNDKGLQPIYDSVIHHQHIFSATVDRENRIWISTENDGLLIFDRDNVYHFDIKNGLPDNLNPGFCEDREGNMWLGNFKGLVRLSTSYIQQFGKKDGLTMNDARSMFVSDEGNILFGHPAEGFSIWNQHKFFHGTYTSNKKEKLQFNNIINAFAEDEKRNIYFTVYGSSLFQYQNNKLVNLTSSLQINKPALISVVYNKTDSCIYAASDSLLFKFRDGRLIKQIAVISNSHLIELNNIWAGQDDNIWISGTHGELGIFNCRKNIYYNLPVDFNHAVVSQVVQDKDGSVWVATRGSGVFKLRLDNAHHVKNIFSISKDNGLPGDIIQNIAINKDGYVWILCTNGVTRFNPNYRNSDGNFSFQNFSSEDGITTKSFSDGCLQIDHDNNVWLGTPDGVFKFDNKKIFTDSIPPKIQIEKIVLIDDSSGWKSYTKNFSDYFQTPTSPVLPYNKNNLTVYYNGIALSKNNEVEYAYKLSGLDTNWNSSTLNKYASFINLLPGKYVFHVKTRRKNYNWSNEAIFEFTIEPPFWETWWFRTLIVLTASATLIFVFNNRIKQIRKKAALAQQMKDLESKALKAQMNPHFIYNAMNSIQSLIIKEESEKAIRYLGKFAKLLRQVLNNSDKSLTTIDTELSSLQLYIELEALRLHKDFDYEIEVQDSIAAEEELMPPLVLQPYVENALWHGLSNKEGERKLKINVTENGTHLVFEMTDNGIGRARAEEIKPKDIVVNEPKGLSITQRRLSLMNDEDDIPVVIQDLFDEAGNAAGTKVTLKIKKYKTQ